MPAKRNHRTEENGEGPSGKDAWTQTSGTSSSVAEEDTLPSVSRRRRSEEPGTSIVLSTEEVCGSSSKIKNEEDLDGTPQGPTETQPRKRKRKRKRNGESSTRSKCRPRSSTASNGSTAVPAVSGYSSKKKKPEEDLDWTPRGPAGTRTRTKPSEESDVNTIIGAKVRALHVSSSTPQRPNGAGASPASSSAAGGPRRRTRRRRRAEREQADKIVLQEDFDPSDYPVLALKGPSQRHFRKKYLKLEKIGAGGYGTVFSGVRRSDGLPVAIKTVRKSNILLTTVVGESGRQYQLPSEVVLLFQAGGDSSCVGQNAAVSLIEWFELKTQITIVMEKPEESMNLRALINQLDEALSEDMAKDIVRSISRSVMEVLDRGVFHRDIKCENVLIQICPQSGYRVRIVDFGCSSELEEQHDEFYAGTMEYAPPEFYVQGLYHAQSTCVWQLGAMLYELLDGEDFTTVDCVERRLKFRKGLSKNCRDFLDSCLNIYPWERLSLQELLSHPWF